jgi:hypothetical protein
VLNIILTNILNKPTEVKFQRLRLSNKNINKAVASCEQSQFILEMLGFKKALLIPEG